MLRAALTILAKDLRLRLRDRSVLLFAFVVPLALTFVFSLVFPDETIDTFDVGVVDRDGGEVAAGFTGGVVPGLVQAEVVEAETFASVDAARQAIEDEQIAAAWVIPEGFSDRVTAGEPADLEVLVNPDRGIAAAVSRGVAESYASQIERTSLAVAVASTAQGGEPDPATLSAITAQAPGGTVQLDELIAPNRQLSASSYLAAGMAVFFLFFTVTFGVTGELEERDQGTLPRLLSAPIGLAAVHLGKALGAFLLGVVSMAVLAVASATLLDAAWGDPVGVAVLVVGGVIAAIGVMLLVGSFAHTAEQASNLQSIVALTFGLAGGVFFPVGTGLLGTLSLASPHGWFLRGLGDLAGASSWTAVLPATGALVAFGVVAAVPAVLRIRRGVW